MVDYLHRLTLKTPESVELSLTLAGIGNRALALGIDYTILTTVLMIYLIVILSLAGVLVDLGQSIGLPSDNLELWIFAIAGLVYFVIYMGYFVFFETLWQGQTPGKRFAHIRSVQDDGRPLGLQQATLRSLLRPVDDLSFVGALMIMASQREKRLGDWLAGTVVVQTGDDHAVPLVMSEAIQQQLLAIRAQQPGSIHTLLSPADFAVLRDFWQRHPQMSTVAVTQISQQLTEQLVGRWQDRRDPWLEMLLPLARENQMDFLAVLYWLYQDR